MSSRSMTGETISPTISAVPIMSPRNLRLRSGPAGMTSATGTPCRVMRKGWRVLLTCSMSPRHLALNFEMGTSRMTIILTIVIREVNLELLAALASRLRLLHFLNQRRNDVEQIPHDRIVRDLKDRRF